MKYILRRKNRTITTELEKVKNQYLKEGYNSYNEKGKLLEAATGGITYTAQQYNKVVSENVELKNKLDRRRTAK
jgi:hypothetical protein